MLASVRLITCADGAEDKRTIYRPFGETRDWVSDAAAAEETKGFIGERYDADGVHWVWYTSDSSRPFVEYDHARSPIKSYELTGTGFVDISCRDVILDGPVAFSCRP